MNWLVDDWKKVLTKSYSAYAFYAMCAFIIVPELFLLLFKRQLNPYTFTWLLLAGAGLGLVGRLVKQPDANKKRRKIIVWVILLAIAIVSAPSMAQSSVPSETIRSSDYVLIEHNGFIVHKGSTYEDTVFVLVSKWEGEHKIGPYHVSYQDIVGVWTNCYGHTATAEKGQLFNDDQCYMRLIRDLKHYNYGMRDALSARTLWFRLPPLREAAYTSLCYNVGIKACSRSTAIRRLNKGDISGGCKALTWWNKAGGRVVRGLVRRRSEERELCEVGLDA